MIVIVMQTPEVLVVPRHDVIGDVPEVQNWAVMGGELCRAVFNPQSAVSAILTNGKKLGLKPGEFDFVCPFVARAETMLPVEADRTPGHPWRVFGDGEILAIDGRRYRVVRVDVGVQGWRLELEG